MTDHQFLAFATDDESAFFINVAQIRQVIVTHNGVDLIFSEKHTIHLEGAGAANFLQRIKSLATAINGDPLKSDKLPLA